VRRVVLQCSVIQRRLNNLFLISLTGPVYVMPESSPNSVAKLDEKRAKREITDANSMPALDVGHARVRARLALISDSDRRPSLVESGLDPS
jgi:hypothetical protein